jgi:adenosine deaminase
MTHRTTENLAPVPHTVRADLARLPKIELHRHLEGSLRLSTLCEIARDFKLDLPTEPEVLRPMVQVLPTDAPTSKNFLSKFLVLRNFYQTPEVIHRLTYEVIEDAAEDNIHYLELRFTPMALSKAGGFALHEVVHWVLLAVDIARHVHPQMQIELIASINRHESVDIAERVTQIAVEHKEDIVGLDLAGDEANFPAEPFAALFHDAQTAGLGITAHAGEWTGVETVRHAIERLGAQRIGHGVRVMEDPVVAALARERGTVFEVCVTSNVQSGVVPRLTDHPLRRMLEAGLNVTVNTDDPAVSDITLTDEYAIASESLGLTIEQVKATVHTAAQASFLPLSEKEKLQQHFQTVLSE